MTRYVPHISSEAKAALELLADKGTKAAEYGDAFYRLGHYLAKRLKNAGLGRKTLLVCTSEDADFLARGIFESISEPTARRTPVAFACFWQTRFDPAGDKSNKKRFEVAPIIKRYEEPIDDEIDSLIVVKSIIATSCVVRHALLDTIERKHPKKIFVVAPVISKDAPARLRAEFPKKVANLFQFVYFATDGTLIPRIVTERRQKHEAELLRVSL
jgi:hypothetical protein